MSQINVEKVARAICEACEENPDFRGDCRGNQYRWEDYKPVAQAAIDEIAGQMLTPKDDLCGQLSAELRATVEQRDRLLAALKAAQDFIDGIREDLHSQRSSDWYPEGANTAALSMSESMRLIGNACADFAEIETAIASVERKEPRGEGE